MKVSKYLLITLLLLLAILPLLPASPLIQHVPTRDSGIFLYVSSRLLKGDLLYKNIWDDKPPLIFWINAFGLWFSGGSRWGVWVLEVIFILAAVWVAFSVLERSFGNIAAALGIISGLAILLLTLLGGNFTEEYAIPFQFASIFFLVKAEQKGGIWPALGCGIALGIIFFLRQDLVGVGIAIALYLVLRAIIDRSWKPCIQLAFIVLGAMGIIAVFLSYMAVHGILPEFWDAAFLFSMTYSNLGLLEHLKALAGTLHFFSQIPLLLLSLPAWLLALFLLLRHGTGTMIKIIRNRWTGWVLLTCGVLLIAAGVGSDLLPGSRSGMGLLQEAALIFGMLLIVMAVLHLFGLLPRLTLPRLEKITYHLPPASISIIAVTVLWYPIEVVVVNLSGRSYLHYYMAICAVCTVLFAFLADQIKRILGVRKNEMMNILLVAAWSIGIALTLAYNPINTMRAFYTPGSDNDVYSKAVRYIEANTQPDDKVLIWGAEPVVNFLSGRGSPLRFPYIYPFYTIHYKVEAFFDEVLGDIQTKKTVLIISTGEIPFISMTSDHQCELPNQPLFPDIKKVLETICSNYHYVGMLDHTIWKIFHID